MRAFKIQGDFMKLFYLNEITGQYEVAGKKEVLAGAQAIARLQHLKPTISSASGLLEYLQLNMMLMGTEELRIVYVNNANKIIKDEVLSQGLEDQTAVYPRMIVRKCLELYATGAIIVHNHPTGLLRPSNADLAITKALVTAFEALDLRFLDHVIIGSEEKGYFSFRENGLI